MTKPITGPAMEPWPTLISAITLFTEELEETKRFYVQIFGLPVVFETDNSAVFLFGKTMINLLRISQADELLAPARAADRDAGARAVFTITVEDVDALCAELTARGVELINGPMDRPWGIRTASFSDPGGHIWEIAK